MIVDRLAATFDAAIAKVITFDQLSNTSVIMELQDHKSGQWSPYASGGTGQFFVEAIINDMLPACGYSRMRLVSELGTEITGMDFPASRINVLTVKQPWASMLLVAKDVENRSWSTKHRGWILILAGRMIDREIPADLNLTMKIPDPTTLPRGAVVGAIKLADVVDDSQSIWAESGCWHWCHDPDVSIMFDTPIPWRGSLGLTQAPPDLLCEVAAELNDLEQIAMILGLG